MENQTTGRALADNVRHLLALTAEKEEAYKDLLRVCLEFIKEVQITSATTRHLTREEAVKLLQRQRTLITTLTTITGE